MANLPLIWGSSCAEVEMRYPSDGVLTPPLMEAYRAISVAASPAEVYRWLCQLKVAPYSYDILNNLGKQSPRTLTPGAEALAIGQRFIRAFALRSYIVNEHLTIRVNTLGRIMFGELIISYVVRGQTDGSTRLMVKLTLPRAGWFGWARQWFLAWLDLLMMRRQLMNLRDLAEGEKSRRASRTSPSA